MSATTRRPRPGETQGRDYWFLTDEEFDRRLQAGEFVEHAEYSGHRYGTLRSELEQRTGMGRPVVLEIEVQGARQVRETMPEAQFVFLAPPSWEELVRRLVGRGTETAAERERRLETATLELAAEKEFDVTIVNASVREAADQLVKLIRSPSISGKS